MVITIWSKWKKLALKENEKVKFNWKCLKKMETDIMTGIFTVLVLG